MNFVPGTVTLVNGRPALSIDGVIVNVPAERHPALSALVGKVIDVGLRPEHFLAGGDEGFEVNVDMAELLGPSTLIHFSFAGASCCATVLPALAAREGGRQRLRISGEQISLFDPETGRAI